MGPKGVKKSGTSSWLARRRFFVFSSSGHMQASNVGFSLDFFIIARHYIFTYMGQMDC